MRCICGYEQVDDFYTINKGIENYGFASSEIKSYKITEEEYEKYGVSDYVCVDRSSDDGYIKVFYYPRIAFYLCPKCGTIKAEIKK